MPFTNEIINGVRFEIIINEALCRTYRVAGKKATPSRFWHAHDEAVAAQEAALQGILEWLEWQADATNAVTPFTRHD